MTASRSLNTGEDKNETDAPNTLPIDSNSQANSNLFDEKPDVSNSVAESSITEESRDSLKNKLTNTIEQKITDKLSEFKKVPEESFNAASLADKFKRLSQFLDIEITQSFDALSENDETLLQTFVDNSLEAYQLTKDYKEYITSNDENKKNDFKNQFNVKLSTASTAFNSLTSQPIKALCFAALSAVAAAAAVVFAWPVVATGALAFGLSLAAGTVSAGAAVASIGYFKGAGLFANPKFKELKQVEPVLEEMMSPSPYNS